MDSNKQESFPLVQQNLALEGYLQSLLKDVDTVSERQIPDDLRIKEKESTQEKNGPQLSKTSDEFLGGPVGSVPDWARNQFQSWSFRVGGLLLATPARELSKILPFPQKFSRISGQPAWIIGMLDDHGDKIALVNTQVLLLGGKTSIGRDPVRFPYHNILITKDGRFGLACDEFVEFSELKPANVRWRSSVQSRPWLIGTVIEKLSALVDLSLLIPDKSWQ